jgi:enterochelin esterase-like enzyme
MLLIAVFCGLLVWLALTRQPVLRVLAACLAFIPAMLFGVAAVNKYYDYYQTWGAVAADLAGQGLTTVPVIPHNVSASQLGTVLDKVTNGKLASQAGETVKFTVTGSNITRSVYVYLPPQYFQSGFSHYRFPAIELLSGYPGEPQDWINVVNVPQAYLTLLSARLVQPAVLVMPDPNGSPRISLQCLNVVHGPQDATYLARDVPTYLTRTLRLQPPGRAWGIAGYSEGGFCAANLALLYPAKYGYVGVLSGYFYPSRDRLAASGRLIDPFAGSSRLRRLNTPLLHVTTMPLSTHIPQFWLGAGNSNRQDVTAVRNFQQALVTRQPAITPDLVPGASHNMATWRALVPPLLEWMTPLLTSAAQHPQPAHPHIAGQAAAKPSPSKSR